MQLAERSGIGSWPVPSVNPSAARVGELGAGPPQTADLLLAQIRRAAFLVALSTSPPDGLCVY